MKYLCPQKNYSEAMSSAGDAEHSEAGHAPRIVIRGETITNPPTICHKYLANNISFIDYLSFSYTPQTPEDSTFPLSDELIHIFNIPPHEWKKCDGGWYGYTNKVKLGDFGIVAWGGSSQRGTYHVELTGTGCNQVLDWLDIFHWGTKNKVKITRLDIAHDDLNGTVVNIKNSLSWVDQGLFISTGRPPKARLVDDFDSGDGKTLYIGKRKNGRLIRIYEKGKELGDPSSEWCRAELETRSKDRKIEWDAVINPDHYIAGSCKAFSFLSSEQSKIKTLSKSKAITLEAAIHYCKTGYGKLINTLHHEEGYEPAQIVDMLSRTGIPEKLKHKYPLTGL